MQQSTMKYSYLKTIILLLATMISCTIYAQNTIHPGDANNNGQVEKTDFLYIAFAYDAIGPSRVDQSTSFSEIEIPVLWDEFFDDGNDTNFAHADCDGNGWVSWQDLLVSVTNYSESADEVEELSFPDGNPNIDPQVKFQYNPNGGNQLFQGSTLNFPISIASQSDPVDHLLGFTFTISYDHSVIKDLRIDYYPDSWLTDDGNTFLFQDEPFGSEGLLDAATVRYGQANAISGGGIFGEVSVIIEEDLVGLLPGDSMSTTIYITEISMITDDFSSIPVATDSLKLMVYDIDAITSINQPNLEDQVQVFPNPTNEHIYIHSNIGIESVEILDLLGKRVAFYPLKQEYQTKISLSKDSANNVYIARINTREGVLSKRIIRKPK